MKKLNFGQNLQIIRVENDIPIEAISFAMGMTDHEYSLLEKRISPPKQEIIDQLCEVLEINEALLLRVDITPKHINEASYYRKLREVLISPNGLLLYAIAGISFIYSIRNLTGHVSDFVGSPVETSRNIALGAAVAAFVFLVTFLTMIYRRKV